MKTQRSIRPSNAAALAAAVSIALVAGIGLAASVAAQEAKPRMISDSDALRNNVPPVEHGENQRWRQLDTDGDGRISRSEGRVDPDFDSNFEMMDADSDGYINIPDVNEDDQSDLLEPEEEDEQR